MARAGWATGLAAALAVGAGALGQTTITLRASAAAPAGAQALRLSDVAEVRGDEAAALGDVPVAARPAPDGTGGLVVDVAAVRAALESGAKVNWGKLTLRGGSCRVSAGEPEQPRVAAPAVEKGSLYKPGVVDLSGPATVRTAIASRLAGMYGVEPERLRLGFDPGDEGVLATATDGLVVDVRVGATAGSARVPVTVHLYEGERVRLSAVVQADVLVRRGVVVAAGTIDRGATIGAGDVEVREDWMTPARGGGGGAGVEEVVGSVARRRIAAGQVIDGDAAGAAVACKRGDTVYIHCLSGGIVVKAKARALGSARDGELVQLKVDGADEPVTARMSGVGRAVLVARGAEASEGPAPSVYGGGGTGKRAGENGRGKGRKGPR